MDPSLSFSCHIDRLVNRCVGLLIGILNAKHALPPSLLPKIIDTLVFSHVRYCAQVYGSANSSNVSKLQKVFNFAARVISGRRKYDHISEVLTQLCWLSAQQFISYFDLCLMHDILITGRPHALRASITYNHERATRHTRQSNHLSLPRVKNNHGKRQFMYRAAKSYNMHALAHGIRNESRRAARTNFATSVGKPKRLRQARNGIRYIVCVCGFIWFI